MEPRLPSPGLQHFGLAGRMALNFPRGDMRSVGSEEPHGSKLDSSRGVWGSVGFKEAPQASGCLKKKASRPKAVLCFLRAVSALSGCFITARAPGSGREGRDGAY